MMMVLVVDSMSSWKAARELQVNSPDLRNAKKTETNKRPQSIVCFKVHWNG